MKFWQILVAIIVVAGVAGGSYWVYNWKTAPPKTTSAIPSTTQLTSAQMGNLLTTVSSSGSVVYPTRQTLTFGISGTVKNVYVTLNQAVKKGDKIADLDNSTTMQLQKNILQAQLNLQNAQEVVQALMHPYTQDQIDAAQAAVDKARQALVDLQAKQPFDLADAQYSVFKAEQSYYANVDKLSKFQIFYQDLDNSKLAWDKSKLNLANLIRNQDQAVTDAQKAITTAQDALADLTDYKPDSLQLDVKQSDVDAARTALADAQAKAKLTVVTAPIDGVITTTPIVAGNTVNANTTIVEIMDPTDIEVSATLDEIDVPSVKVGQKVNVSLSSYSDVVVPGTVYSIADTGKTQSGVVTYAIFIKLTPPKDMTVRQGMSATADIVVQQIDNVLLVPNQALTGSGSRATVNVVVNGALEPRSVTVGATDGTRSEVTDGLQAGDQVALRTSSSSSTARTTAGSTTTRGATGTFSGFPTGGGAVGGGGGPVIIQGR